MQSADSRLSAHARSLTAACRPQQTSCAKCASSRSRPCSSPLSTLRSRPSTSPSSGRNASRRTMPSRWSKTSHSTSRCTPSIAPLGDSSTSSERRRRRSDRTPRPRDPSCSRGSSRRPPQRPAVGQVPVPAQPPQAAPESAAFGPSPA
eukprot:Amastigsp_a175467_218.p3 type:complete len:148 gc:universal Amastigsp_a175467_218:466-23(-)